MPEQQTEDTKSEKVWALMIELRKELVESQKIRSQVVGFKITFVTAVIGFLAKSEPNDNAILVVPAFAAMCFDLLIYSYSFSIKRIGCYIREHVEPALHRHDAIPADFRMWQDFLTERSTMQRFALFGNMGFTSLTLVVGIIALCLPFRPLLSSGLIAGLLVFFVVDIWACKAPGNLGKQWREDDDGGPGERRYSAG